MHKLSTLLAGALISFTTAVAAAPPPNYDPALLLPAPQAASFRAASQPGAAPREARSLLARKLPSYRGYPSQLDAASSTASFIWAGSDAASERLAPLTLERQPEAAARRVLEGQFALLGVTRASIAQARLSELQDHGSGPVIARFQQLQDGLEVYGRRLNVLLDHDLKPIAVSGRFEAPPAGAASQRGGTTTFALDAAQAIASAYTDLTGAALQQPLSRGGEHAGYLSYRTQASSGKGWQLLGEPRSKRLYYPLASALEPAYYVELRVRAQGERIEERAYGYLVSAVDGRVLARKNLVADLDVSYRVWADAGNQHQPFDGPLGNALSPVPSLDPSAVIPRTPAATQLVRLASGPISTRDPWLLEGQNDTFGNHVDAYLDLAGYDGLQPAAGDMRATMTAPGVFDYNITADSDPSDPTSRLGAVVNLFYLNNWLHDDWYDHGFDEAAGNAQLSNYGRGGVDQDPINAEGQDFSGTDNSNMLTPPDGGRPRMQMYLFSAPAKGQLQIREPAAIGDLKFNLAEFGPTTFELQQQLVLVDDGTGNGADGCDSPYVNAAQLAGHIALIERGGGCPFTQKTANAQAAGAVAVIIANNVASGGAIALGGTDPGGITIGTLSISKDDGARLEAALGQGAVSAYLRRDFSLQRDGTLDNGIIAHEYFHYVSNRLVGDAMGLVNNQGAAMGEGWSDFASLLLAVREEDRLVPGNDHYQGAYSTGVYVNGSVYFGIRRTPYSTDMAIDPLTFKHIEEGVALPTSAPLSSGQDGADNAEVHASGEIWANTLWEFYAALLNDPRYSFAQARSRMQDYVIGGLKMTPLAPTFLEARDALLAVVAATDAGDFELAAKAFAKRGMGVGARAPDRGSLNHAGVVESYVALAGAFEVSSLAFDYNYDDGSAGYCSKDGKLDVGETAAITLKIRSYGTRELDAPVTAQLSSDGDVSFANDGKLVFQLPATGDKEATATTTAKLLHAQTAQPLRFFIDFPQVGTDPGSVIEPQPLATRIRYVNYDRVGAYTTDSVERLPASDLDWGRVDPESAADWQIDTLDQHNHFWFAPDTAYASEPTLTSPELQVAPSGEFSVSFDHWYQFEFYGDVDGTPYGFDGGYLDISIDGAPYFNVANQGGTFTEGGYNGKIAGVLPQFDIDAFVGSLNPEQSLQHSRLSFGEALAGHRVRLRFHASSDAVVGDLGWMVDNIAFSGISNLPFSAVQAYSANCDAHLPHADAGADFVVDDTSASGVPTRVTLAGKATDLDAGSTLTLGWLQTSGPAVVVDQAASASPSFTAPKVSAETALSFRLQVSDGRNSSEDSVVVKVRPVEQAASGGGGGGPVDPLWLLLASLALGLRVRLRRSAASLLHTRTKTMRHIATLRLLAALAMTSVSTLAVMPAAAQQAPSIPEYLQRPALVQPLPAPTGLIVKFKQPAAAAAARSVTGSARARAARFVDALPAKARAALNAAGARPRAAYSRFGLLAFDTERPLDETIDALYRSGSVEYAVPDYARSAQSRYPNDDPYILSMQWGLDDYRQQINIGYFGLGDRDINAPEAWQKQTDASGVVVAILDAGLDYSHADLIDNLWRNPKEIPDNGIDDDGNGYVDDVYGIDTINGDSDPSDYEIYHGAINAGIIGGVGNNGIGLAGVAWRVQMMTLKVLTRQGRRGDIIGSDSAIIEAIDYVLAQKEALGLKRVIINTSLGSYDDSPALREAYAAAQQAGVLVVTSAGNFARDNDSTPFYPANYELDNIISVGAMANSYLGRADFSNYGCGSVDILAPGFYISGAGPAGNYLYGVGTSQSAALVSGIAALVWGQRPDASWEEVKSAVLSGVKPMADLRGLSMTQGIARADQALDAPGDAPVIWQLTPARARPGASLTIRGRHFGSVSGSAQLRVDGQPLALAVKSWSDREVVVQLPADASYGGGEVVLQTAAAQASTSACLDVSDQAVAVGTLSQPRSAAAAAQIGDSAWIAGGRTAYGVTALVERYDFASKHAQVDTAWMMPHALYAPAAAALDGKLYLVGGADGSEQVAATLLVFDPASGAWSSGPDLPEPLAYAAAATAQGKLYVFGGTRNTLSPAAADYAATSYIYDPASRTWSRGADMPIASYGRSAIADPAGGRILVMGGFVDGQGAVAQVDAYDLKANRWSAAPALGQPRAQAAVLADNDAVYLLHGDGDPYYHGHDSGELLAAGKWSPAVKSPAFLISPTAVAADGKGYVFGGDSWNLTYSQLDHSATVWAFDLAARPAVPPAAPASGSGGGGAFDVTLLLPLALLGIWRRRRRALLLLSGLLALSASLANAAEPASFVPLRTATTSDRIIVKFKHLPLPAAAKLQASAGQRLQSTVARLPLTARSALSAIGAQPLKLFERSGLISLKTTQPVATAIEALYRSGAVEYAVADFTRHAQAALPNDPLFNQQWGLANIGQEVRDEFISYIGIPDRDINAPEAWAVRTDASDVVVAVLDTGIYYVHEDLAANMWHNPLEIPGNGIDDDGNGYVDDVYGIDTYNHDSDPGESGHGTAVAGLIGAVGNNGIGTSGVAWEAQMMAVQVLDSATLAGSDSAAIEGIEYVIAVKQAQSLPRVIINASWGGLESSPALRDAFAAAQAAGILVVAPAGNYSSDSDTAPQYPASFDFDGIISVGGTSGDAEGRATTSNFGCSAVDLFAPETALETTDNTIAGFYSLADGTSYAAGLVSGAAALTWAQYPSASMLDIKSALLAGTKPLPDLARSSLSEGLLRVDGALAAGPLRPAIWNAAPSAVGPGQVVKLRGHRFGSAAGRVLLRRDSGDVALAVQSWTDDAISATVPESASYGDAKLVVEVAGGALSNTACFAVADHPTLIGEMIVPRSDSAYVQIGDKLWIIGGQTYYGATSMVERFDVATKTSQFDPGWMMPRPVTAMDAAAIDDKIYVVGGLDAASMPVDALQIFDTTHGSWSSGAPLPEGLAYPAAAAVGGKLYVFGGNRNQFPPVLVDDISSKTYVYDPLANRWSEGAALPQAVANAGASVDAVDGQIMLLGGYALQYDYGDFPAVDTVQNYDTASGQWSTGTPMLFPRHGMGVLRYKDAVYAINGVGDPLFGAWTHGEVYSGGHWTRALMSEHTLTMPAVGQWQTLGFILGGYEPNYGWGSAAQIWQFELLGTVDAPPPPPPPPPETPQGSGGGGSFDWTMLLLLFAALGMRQQLSRRQTVRVQVMRS